MEVLGGLFNKNAEEKDRIGFIDTLNYTLNQSKLNPSLPLNISKELKITEYNSNVPN